VTNRHAGVHEDLIADSHWLDEVRHHLVARPRIVRAHSETLGQLDHAHRDSFIAARDAVVVG
jgi:hypothetical protein